MGTRTLLIRATAGCGLGLVLGIVLVGASRLVVMSSGSDESFQVPEFLGQDQLAICVDTQIAGAEDRLQIAVREAIDTRTQNAWSGTYIDALPVEIAIGCPLEPLRKGDVYIADAPQTRFFLHVWLVDDQGAVEFETRHDYVPLRSLEGGPADAHDWEFVSYAIFVREDQLSSRTLLSDAIGAAVGLPSPIPEDSDCGKEDLQGSELTHCLAEDELPAQPTLNPDAPSR